MDTRRPARKIVTLVLQDGRGDAWPLRLSSDCLCFIGRYRRVEGFKIDAMTLFDGLSRDG